MTISSSFSRTYSRDLKQHPSTAEGQPVNPNLNEGQPVNPNLFFGQPVNPNLAWDLKFISAVNGVLKQSTEATMVLPMVLASPVFSLGKVGALRGLLGATAETWWSRGLSARFLSSFAGFLGETTFFSTASRGLNHLMGKPASWDLASQAQDWVGAGLSLGLLKTGSFLGRQVPLPLSGQASGYLSLVGAHYVEEKAGYRQANPGGNLWLDTAGDYLAMGLGAFAGRSLLGSGFTALEQRLSLEAKILHGQMELPRWLRGESWVMASAVGGGGQIDFPGILQMSGIRETGEVGPVGGTAEGEGRPPSDIRELAAPVESPGSPSDTADSLIPTHPQTATREKPQFIVDAAAQNLGELFYNTETSDWEPLNCKIRSQDVLIGKSQLNREDGRLFTQFVLDRLPDYPVILKRFSLPDEIQSLDKALFWFVERFSDESEIGMVALLRELKITPKVRPGVSSTGEYQMLNLMREAKTDSIDYLQRLGKLPNRKEIPFEVPAYLFDPNRLKPQMRYSLADWRELVPDFPELNEDVFLKSYDHMLRQRVLSQMLHPKKAQGVVPFVVADAGHEIQGTATAFAMLHEVNPKAFAISPHYRSGTLVGMWAQLQGYPDFFADYLRQQLSRITDPWSKGRQTASHFNDQRYHILPGQSEVGRNLLKAVGYARALQEKGFKDGVVYAEIGDGSMALSDLHEAMSIAAVGGYHGRTLPVVFAILNNEGAISVEPSSGRPISNLEYYAKAFDMDFYTYDGGDYLEAFQTNRVALYRSMKQQKGALIEIRVPRLNNHSSATHWEFDFKQHDPLPDFARSLVEEGLLPENQVLRRNSDLRKGDFFANHDLGERGRAAKQYIEGIWDKVFQEPEPTLEQTLTDIRIELPEVPEPVFEKRPTKIIINGAIRAAYQHQFEDNPTTWAYGQDIGKLGDVNKATAGLWEKFHKKIQDSLLNEPAEVGAAIGYALMPGNSAIVRIQYSYPFAADHHLLAAGMMLYSSGGTRQLNFNVCLCVEPGIRGAMWHSMPLDGHYFRYPGWIVISPSTTVDSYGLNRSALEHPAPTMILEPTALFRKAVGDAFPNESRDEKERDKLNAQILNHRAIPDIPRDFRIPLGKGAIRRKGKDLTIITWGLAHYYALEALDKMEAKGIDVELIDARTLAPFDLELFANSVGKTGRLLVAHQDRVFGGLGREIAAQVEEALPNQRIHKKFLGMLDVPSFPQSPPMEDAIMVDSEKIMKAALELMDK